MPREPNHNRADRRGQQPRGLPRPHDDVELLRAENEQMPIDWSALLAAIARVESAVL